MGARTLTFNGGATLTPDDGEEVYPVWRIPAGRIPDTPPPWSAPGVFCVAPDGVAALARECWPRLPDSGERIEGFVIARVDSARDLMLRRHASGNVPRVVVEWETAHPPPLRAKVFTFGLIVSTRLGGNPPEHRLTYPCFGAPGNWRTPVEVGASAPGLDPSRRFGIVLSAGDIVATNVRGTWEVAVVS